MVALLPKGGVVYRLREKDFDCIRIGFIGAGKVGVSLGKYLKSKGQTIGGYYSRNPESARWAAEFTETSYETDMKKFISSCDMILFTVPDGAIASVWEEAKPYTSGKIIGHCSGIHSSDIFSDAGSTQNYACSIHPLFAISSKEHSWRELSSVLFTIEGSGTHLKTIEALFRGLGNPVTIISAENKIRYHAAAALASNYMTALFHMAEELFLQCGFEEEEARKQLYALAKGNLDHILVQGCADALTGPVERNDCGTVQLHMDAISPDMKEVYRNNAGYLIRLAEQKHPDRDYTRMKETCRNGGKHEKYGADPTENERKT